MLRVRILLTRRIDTKWKYIFNVKQFAHFLSIFFFDERDEISMTFSPVRLTSRLKDDCNSFFSLFFLQIIPSCLIN